MNIEMLIDGKTKHVQFTKKGSSSCLISDSPIPGSGIGGDRTTVTKEELMVIAIGHTRVEQGDVVRVADDTDKEVTRDAPVKEGDVFRVTETVDKLERV